MDESYIEIAALGLGLLFCLALGLCAANARANKSKQRRKSAPFSCMNPAWIDTFRANLLKNASGSRRRRKMLTMGNEQVDEQDLSKNNVIIKDSLPKTLDQRFIEKALLENEIMRQRLLACLYKYDPYYEYY